MILKNSLEDIYKDEHSPFPKLTSAINYVQFITSTGIIYIHLVNKKKLVVIWGFVTLHLVILSSVWIIYAFQHENNSSVLIAKLLRDRIIRDMDIGERRDFQDIPNVACHSLEKIYTGSREIGEHLFEDPIIGILSEECVKALATDYNKLVFISIITTFVLLYLQISNYLWIVAFYYAKQRFSGPQISQSTEKS
ncbi:hypothetical protein RF11_12808 [Thelohanellus kitauei]|uniref:Uncharacterized protein n=1 Tax=Thelohanellus kitauei TaxID=669202 RepID=A0A0C2MAN1_THEKT|nr:hypothetical protein RF11_12808 [Thelohanellus kitauei]